MKFRDIHFVTNRDDHLFYLRGHLRWLELVDAQTLRFAFSAETVIVKGQHLEKLLGAVFRGEELGVIAQQPSRHADPDTWSIDSVELT